MTVKQLVCDTASPINIIGEQTGKLLKRNVTMETLNRNPNLGALNVLGVQTTIMINSQLMCWVDECAFNANKS